MESLWSSTIIFEIPERPKILKLPDWELEKYTLSKFKIFKLVALPNEVTLTLTSYVEFV